MVLKRPPNFVLGRSHPSTYKIKYASESSLPAASLAGLLSTLIPKFLLVYGLLLTQSREGCQRWEETAGLTTGEPPQAPRWCVDLFQRSVVLLLAPAPYRISRTAQGQPVSHSTRRSRHRGSLRRSSRPSQPVGKA